MINPTSLPGAHIQNDGIMQCTAAELFLRSNLCGSNRLRYGQWHRRRMWPQACSCSQPHPIAREKASLSCQPANKAKRIGRGRLCKQDCHARVTGYCSCVGDFL